MSAFLSKETYRGLRSILRSYAHPSTKVLVRGIFTHQTPKVLAKGQTKSVEIGDLMLVHQHFSTDPRHPDCGRAILFQAKRTRTARTGSLAKDTAPIQFELYQGWPEFKGETRLASSPSGASLWDFKNPSADPSQPATDGADYLTVFKGEAYQTPSFSPQWKATVAPGADFRFVRKNYPNASTWSTGTCPPAPSAAKLGVSCRNDFSATLCDFLLGRKGRAFEPNLLPPTRDHWSLFVNQMLELSARPNGDYVYTSSNQGVASGLRGRNLGFLSRIPTLFHSAIEELEECIEMIASGGRHPGFEFTNSILDRIDDENHGGQRGEPPVRDAPENAAIPFGGHVPLLLVLTRGPHEYPFSLQAYPEGKG
ncbi:hypothetical protein [Ralstonia pseudosolanacearum]